jgi:hypothetical protein
MNRTTGDGTWRLESVPSLAHADTVLNAISTVAGEAWAVGTSDPDGPAPARTFVAYRNVRGGWQIVASLHPGAGTANNSLNAVFAAQASSCEDVCRTTVTAAGTTLTAGGARLPLVMSMSYPVGTSPSPSAPGWTLLNPDPKVLPALACGDPTGTDIELFAMTGFQDIESPLVLAGRRGRCPLILTFFTYGWRDESPGGTGVLYALGAGWFVGANNLLVRSQCGSGGCGYVRVPVSGLAGRCVEWQAVTARPDGSVWVAGLASRTATRCALSDPVLARWDGHSWQLSPVQPLPAGGAFYGIAATTQNSLWSVGTSGPNRFTLIDGR